MGKSNIWVFSKTIFFRFQELNIDWCLHTHTHLPPNVRPRTPYLGPWYSCRFLAWHLTPSRCSVPVGRRSQRNSSATSIVTLVHQRVSWRRTYDWCRKPDFCRWMISGPPIRFAGACWQPPAPPHPTQTQALCSTGGVVTNLEKFYPGNTVMGLNTLEPQCVITCLCEPRRGGNEVPVSAARPLYVPSYFSLCETLTSRGGVTGSCCDL